MEILFFLRDLCPLAPSGSRHERCGKNDFCKRSNGFCAKRKKHNHGITGFFYCFSPRLHGSCIGCLQLLSAPFISRVFSLILIFAIELKVSFDIEEIELVQLIGEGEVFERLFEELDLVFIFVIGLVEQVFDEGARVLAADLRKRPDDRAGHIVIFLFFSHLQQNRDGCFDA
mgnify:CR=1 FL=1